MAEVIKLERGAVLKLMAKLGWGSAHKWKNEKLADNLKSIKDVADPSKPPEEEDNAALLQTILAGLEKGDSFQVEGEDSAATSEGGGGVAGEAKPKKEKAPKKEKVAKVKKEKAPKAAKAPKERAENKMRAAGIVVKELGVDAPFDQMIAKLNSRYEPANDDTSAACLKAARDAIQGYLGVPSTAPNKPAKAETPKVEATPEPAAAPAAEAPKTPEPAAADPA